MKSLLIALLYSTVALADCNYTLTLGNFTTTIGDTAQALPHSMAISRGKNSSGCRNYRLFFGKGQANSYQRRAYSAGNSLTYNLYRTVSLGNILKDYCDAATNEYVSGTLTSRNVTYNATWFVEVKSKDTLFSVPPGTYTDTLPVHAYSNDNGDLEHEGTRYMTLSFVVPRYAEVSVVPETQSHNPSSTLYVMDFGTMIPQEELRADLMIKANVPYGMHVSSMNGGFLKKSPATTNVPYQIQIGSSGWITPPTSPYWLGQENSGSPQSGRRYNVKVRLGNFSNLDDGDYTETITITVSAY